MSFRANLLWAAALACLALVSRAEPAFDAAKAFGARESVLDLSLSPDGMSVAYVAPAAAQGSVLYVQSPTRAGNLARLGSLPGRFGCARGDVAQER
jgi:hypothetical protein